MGKGSITLYVIIGLVLVLTVGLFLYSGDQGTLLREKSQSVEFSGMRSNLKIYVEGCLEQTTLKAIENFGLQNSEKDLEAYIDSRLFDCIDFGIFKGYNLEYEPPASKVTINENQLYVELSFPINVKHGSDEIDLHDFVYKFRSTTIVETPNGIMSAGTVLLTQDDDFVMKADKDTIVLDKNGNPVEVVSIKTLDKEFNGLHNGVVVGEVAYEGLPDGATFDPPLTVTIRISKNDIPVGYNPEELKLGYYDEDAGIWFTYTSLPFRVEDDYFYYSASVGHFTAIAVVACGKEGELIDNPPNLFRIPLHYVYQSPIQPIAASEESQPVTFVWQSSTNSICAEGKCAYLKPEDMANAHCLFFDEKSASDTTDVGTEALHGSVQSGTPEVKDRKYNIEYEAGFPHTVFDETKGTNKKAVDQCKAMIKDWDADDITKTNPLPNCYAQYKTIIGKYLLANVVKTNPEYYKLIFGQESTTSPTPEQVFSFFFDETVGDGIAESITGEPCAITDKFDDPTNIALIKSIMATPKTYGFSKVIFDSTSDTIKFDSSTGSPSEYVGGYSAFNFVLNEKGDSCIDTFNKDAKTSVNLLAPIFYDSQKPTGAACSKGDTNAGFDPATIISNKNGLCGGNLLGPLGPEKDYKVDSGDGITCSSGDICLWRLNPTRFLISISAKISEGKLKAGENAVGVIVNNKGLIGSDMKEADAYANAYLEIKGTGIKGGFEKCSTNLQDRLNYLNGCGGPRTGDASYLVTCLAILRDKLGFSREGTLCDINGDKSNPDSTQINEMNNLIYFDYKGKCDKYLLDVDSELSTGGICATCQNGQKNGNSEKCKICPGKLTPGVDATVNGENGCYCGNTPYTGKEDQIYCCNGYFKKEECNMQVSPIALKKAAAVCEYTINTDSDPKPKKIGNCVESTSCTDVVDATYNTISVDCTIGKICCGQTMEQGGPGGPSQPLPPGSPTLTGTNVLCCVGTKDSTLNYCPVQYFTTEEMQAVGGSADCTKYGLSADYKGQVVDKALCTQTNANLCKGIVGCCIDPAKDCFVDPNSISEKAEFGKCAQNLQFISADKYGKCNRDELNALCDSSFSCCDVKFASGEPNACVSQIDDKGVPGDKTAGQFCLGVKTKLNPNGVNIVDQSLPQIPCNYERASCLNLKGTSVDFAENFCKGSVDLQSDPGYTADSTHPDGYTFKQGTRICGNPEKNWHEGTLYICQDSKWQNYPCFSGCKETDDGYSYCYNDSQTTCKGDISMNAQAITTLGGVCGAVLTLGGALLGGVGVGTASLGTLTWAGFGWGAAIGAGASSAICGVSVPLFFNSADPNIDKEYNIGDSVCGNRNWDAVYTCDANGLWTTDFCSNLGRNCKNLPGGINRAVCVGE
ncbi:MAG: hypothetical protein ABIJ34_00645 [archaeon]